MKIKIALIAICLKAFSIILKSSSNEGEMIVWAIVAFLACCAILLWEKEQPRHSRIWLLRM
jgi:hypothetical protein